METRRTKEKKEYRKRQRHFKRNAVMIIEKMVELNNHPDSGHTAPLVDEILHSIFFLGKINKPSISPKEIMSNEEMYECLKSDYPGPFDFYSSQLPRRSPFSCVLDMIVHVKGQENEDIIIKELQQFVHELKEDNTNELVSSTICVSQNTKIPNAVRYYGVSMSTSGKNPGKIMVSASCCSFWDDYVAGAVMTYHPTDNTKKFNGTFKVPNSVKCKAFRLSTREPIPPCRSCGTLFGLQTTDNKKWPYGNCAEAESVSNLLKNDKDLKKRAQLTSAQCTVENRQWAKKSVLTELKNRLHMIEFRKWDKGFYTPQTK